MNTEKLHTAFGTFVADFRAWLPEKLSPTQVESWLAILPPAEKSAYQSAQDDYRRHELLLDIGPLAKIAKDQPSILAPYWTGSINSLKQWMQDIREVRNDSAHHNNDLNSDAATKAFSAMEEVLKGFKRNECADQIRVLRQALLAANGAQAQTMTAIWRKQVDVSSALIFLEITYQEQREDIQAFLRAYLVGEQIFKGSHSQLVQNRLVKHFEELGLIDNKGLTPA